MQLRFSRRNGQQASSAAFSGRSRKNSSCRQVGNLVFVSQEFTPPVGQSGKGNIIQDTIWNDEYLTNTVQLMVSCQRHQQQLKHPFCGLSPSRASLRDKPPQQLNARG